MFFNWLDFFVFFFIAVAIYFLIGHLKNLVSVWYKAKLYFIHWRLNRFYQITAISSKKIAAITYENLWLNRCSKLNKFLSVNIAITLVTFAWILFRANSSTDALITVKNMFQGNTAGISLFYQADLFTAFASILFLIGTEFWLIAPKAIEGIYNLKLLYNIKWTLLTCVAFMIFIPGKSDFIDFTSQFQLV